MARTKIGGGTKFSPDEVFPVEAAPMRSPPPPLPVVIFSFGRSPRFFSLALKSVGQTVPIAETLLDRSKGSGISQFGVDISSKFDEPMVTVQLRMPNATPFQPQLYGTPSKVYLRPSAPASSTKLLHHLVCLTGLPYCGNRLHRCWR